MKKLIFISFLIIQFTFSQEKEDDFYDLNIIQENYNYETNLQSKDEFYDFNIIQEDFTYKTNIRYENILNFSKPTYKLNLYSTYIDLRQYSDYSKIYWNLGQGYIYLSNTWDLEYSMEKNFVIYSQEDEEGANYNGWELDFLFRNHLEKADWVGHRWSRSWGFGTSYSDGGDLEYDLFDEKVTDIFLTYRMSTNFDNIGMGGSYLSLTTNGGGVLSSVGNDGYRLNFIVDTFTTWGYGFQTSNTLTNELRSYGNYSNSYLLDFASTTSWTHELSHDFAFITDVYFESENFLNGTERANKIEFSIFPHISYNKKLNNSSRFFAKLGVTPVSIVNYSSGFDDSGFYGKGVMGITYRW